jgi:thiol-disulfide isomerase/thioredoxin
MKLKSVITGILLLFVAAAIVTLIAKRPVGSPPEGGAADLAAATGDIQQLRDGVIVYHFHGNMRCPTCNTIEAHSKEAVEMFFADELNSSRVEFQVVNYDESRNERFMRDYNIGFQSLVLVDIKDGEEVRFKDLSAIWELVGDKDAFFQYVQTEIGAYLSSH